MKWINQHVTSGGQGKNLRPHQDSNLWPSKHRAGALSTWATENSWRARPYTRFIFDTRPAYCKDQKCRCRTVWWKQAPISPLWISLAVKDHSSQLNMTYFLRQLTSLSAGSNQIYNVLVFSNGLHYLQLWFKICVFPLRGILWNTRDGITVLMFNIFKYLT